MTMFSTPIGVNRRAYKVNAFLSRWWLVSSISLMFACILFGGLTGRLYHTNYYNQVEELIGDIEAEFDKTADLWLDTLKTEDASSLWNDKPVVPTMESYNSGIFLFENDSLVYWSKSPMDFPHEIANADTTLQFSFLGNKILLPFVKEKGSRKAVSLITLKYYDSSKGVTVKASHGHIVDTKRYSVVPFSMKGFNVRNKDGKILFGIEPQNTERTVTLIEYFGLLGFLIFCFGITLTAIKMTHRHNPITVVCVTMALIVVLRLLSLYTGFPMDSSFKVDGSLGMDSSFSFSPFPYLTLGNVLTDTLLVMLMGNMVSRVRNRLRLKSREMSAAASRTGFILWMGALSFYLLWQTYITARFVYALYDGKNLVEIFSLNTGMFVVYAIVLVQMTTYILMYTTVRDLCRDKTIIAMTIGVPLVTVALILFFRDYFFGFSCVAIAYVLLLPVIQLIAIKRRETIHFGWYVLLLSAMITVMTFSDSRKHLNADQQEVAITLAGSDRYTNNTFYSYILMDESPIINKASSYSFLKVVDNYISEYNGEYIYGRSMFKEDDPKSVFGSFYDGSKFMHFVYESEKGDAFAVVSRQTINLLDKTTFFVYVFIMLFAGQSVFLIFFSYVPTVYMKTGIYSRVRFAIVGVIILTVGIILWAVSRFFVENERLNVSSKIFNTLFYVNTDYRNTFSTAPADTSAVLMRWANDCENKYQSNINIFNKNGDLIATSSPTALQNKIVPIKINPDIFDGSDIDDTSIVRESSGAINYLSLYSRVKHDDGNVSYLNMLFKDSENKPTALPLVISILNIFVVALSIGLLISLFLYKQIMRPLNLIRQSIKNIRYRKRITGYKKNGSELDLLIDQYNNTITDLEESYEELARREREGAWKVLAQQIAHEIKNPLTPIKLKVQMLQRRKQKGDPNWDADIDDSLSAIVSQIDVLSGIVSEFSNFAKMNMKPLEKGDLSALLNDILQLYYSYPDVTVIYNDHIAPEKAWVMLDADNFRSVIVNMMTNSIYAVNGVTDARVEVTLERDADRYRISISDNGIGIKEEDKEMIFRPSFTTKKTGSGIGLPLAKQIVKNMNGQITFSSTYGVGTVFTIELPVAE